MDQLESMLAFARVAETGSFVSASRALAVAPSSVTRAVAELERRLGTRLMTRTTRRTALTAVGERYLERVRVILREVEDAAALARQAQQVPCGAVRVLVPAGFATLQLAPRLPQFHRTHPQVTVELEAVPAVETLDAGYDVSIVITAAPIDGDFVARALARSRVIACAAPGYLDRAGRPAHPRDLAAHTLLLAPGYGSTMHSAAGERSTLALQPAQMQSRSPELHRAAALAGTGIAALASFAADPALRSGRLERVLPGWWLQELTVWACIPTRRHVPASTRAFLTFLSEAFGGRGDDPWDVDREDSP